MKVYCHACADYHRSEDEVETLNIEEDFHGRDVLTFKCLTTDTEQSSLVFVKWIDYEPE